MDNIYKIELRVKLNGETYFEIFKNRDQPFIVESTGQQVVVIKKSFLTTNKDQVNK